MRRVLGIVTLVATLVGIAPRSVGAGAATDAALALGAFAVFNQLLAPVYWRGYWGGGVIVAPPYAYYPPYPYVPYPYVPYEPPVVYVPPAAPPSAPLVQREVVFPHGRYVLRGDGVTEPYQWIWVPSVTPPAPAPRPTP